MPCSLCGKVGHNKKTCRENHCIEGGALNLKSIVDIAKKVWNGIPEVREVAPPPS